MFSRDQEPMIDEARLAWWWELGEVQAAVLSLFTTGGSWAAGLLDWRGFLAVNLPLIGKAVWALMKKKTYRPV